MIIGKTKNTSVESGSKTAGINFSKLEKLKYILTEGLYKDPESAVIVEITNNAIDSIRESGKDPLQNPVVVDFSNKNGYVMTISDNGIGMDKDFFENFFMQMLSSTKEESEDDIGCFGKHLCRTKL